MRLAILSDIHGNLPALEAIIVDLEQRGVDRVVNLGDSLSGPLLPLETAQLLMQKDWLHLAGNHERQLLTLAPEERGASDAYAYGCLSERELEWLATLPPTAQLGQDVFLCHATPADDMQYLLETVTATGVRIATQAEVDDRLGSAQAELLCCGHTHVARSMRSSFGQLIVNPGSVGLPGYQAHRPFPHAIENGSPDARYAIVERRSGGWHSNLVAVPYRHQEMSKLAEARNRADWARALATGYVAA